MSEAAAANALGKLRAISLVQAALAEDAEALALLSQEPPDASLVVHLTGIASMAMESRHGPDRAAEVVAGWRRLAQAEVAVIEGLTP